MSNAKHTPGPWYVNDDHKAMSEYCVCAESRGKGFGSSVATVTQRDGDKSLPHDEAVANARRIAACINACEGIGTEYLEHFGGTTFNDFKRVKDQRDDLLAALELYVAAGCGDTTSFYKQAEAYDAAIEAIAKAEGQS